MAFLQYLSILLCYPGTLYSDIEENPNEIGHSYESLHLVPTSEPDLSLNLSPLPFMYSEFVYSQPQENSLESKNIEKISSEHRPVTTALSEIRESDRLLKFAEKSNHRGKASRFYEQALKLNPQNINALVGYGEFLEQENNHIQAGEMYYRAMVLDPSDDRLKVCRDRVYSYLGVANVNKFRGMDRSVRSLQGFMASEYVPSEDSVFREMFYLQIYHTVAIEGNTLTLEQVKQVIKTGRSPKGYDHTIHELNEIVGAADAFQYANWTLYRKLNPQQSAKIPEVILPDPSSSYSTRKLPRLLDLKLVKDLHHRIIVRQNPQIAGRYRNDDVYVSGYKAPAANQLSQLMSEFESWLHDMELKVFTERLIHPVEFAAEAHYRLVKIHPFADGNGRLSRLLMNIILMRAGYPPTLIRVEDRRRYFQALNYDAQFLQYIMGATSETLNLYLKDLDLGSDLFLPEVIHDEL